MNEIAKNLENIRQNIRILSEREIQIVPATKTVPPEIINTLYKEGIKAIGENKVQELLEKFDKIQKLDVHFIGALQTNKVKYIVDKVSLIHSVDRMSLADEIEKQSAKLNKITQILVEINIGREENKSGVLTENLDALVNHIKTKKHILMTGIMSVMPINASDDLYGQMNEIFLALQKNDDNIKILSMGMSNDYVKAIKYGANLIRPGSAIFGKRN